MAQGFHVVPAHSVIALANAFAEKIMQRANPLHPETILVMNYAQRVWLQRFLAEKFGVCANFRFMSPEVFLGTLVEKSGDSVFERNALSWRIFEQLKRSRQDTKTPDKEIFYRANELGNLFWRYQSFRPKMIRDWLADTETFPQTADPEFKQEYRRQKKLWREIMPENGEPPAEAWLKILESEKPLANIPPRLFAFAPSALPHLHLCLLEKLAESSEVFLFYHHLSHDFWTETEEEKKLLREKLRPKKRTLIDPDSFPLDGNELLTAWGKAARPLAMHLIDIEKIDAHCSIDEPPPRDTLLHSLQRDIRDNTAKPTPYLHEASDRSFLINVAPSPLREMEILREELTARFSADPTLRPRDVLVTLADLETYTPFIRAAFENSGIPYSIADRTGTDIFPAVSAFLATLSAAHGEMRLDEILALFDLEPVRLGLKLEEGEIAPLRKLLANAGIRWGNDTAFRTELIFGGSEILDEKRPAAEKFAENNSWQFGLKRLAMGYMCGTESDADEFTQNDTGTPPPIADLTENAHIALEKVSTFIEILSRINHAFFSHEEKRVPAWCEFLKKNLTDTIFTDDEFGAHVLREKLNAVAVAAERGKLGDTPVSCTLETLFSVLKMQDWGNSSRSDGMLRGKVTFCRMQPMRNIPAKLICVAGLNEGAFPRAGTPIAADLITFRGKNFSPEIRLWDRSPRDDDNLLFLESILAAQDALILSYVGRNTNDGQVVPPCVPLAKLRDIAVKIADCDPKKNPAFEIHHRLHGFSPDYFSENTQGGSDYFSFSRTDYATACAARGKSTEGRTSFQKTFRFSNFPTHLTQRKFTDFFRSPATFICGNCIGISAASGAEQIQSGDPPTEFSSLSVAGLARKMTEKIIRDKVRGVASALESDAETLCSRILDEGNLSAFSNTELLREKFLNGQFSVRDALLETLPGKMSPLSEEELPRELVFADLRILPDFRNLFRDNSEQLCLCLFGKKEFTWKAAIETFIAAQLLAFAFPKKKFVVYYFAYGAKNVMAITDASLAQSKMTAESLADFYTKNLACPPLLFDDIPAISFGKKPTPPELFFANVEKNYPADAASVFVYGENATEHLQEDILNRTFPFVSAVYASIFAV